MTGLPIPDARISPVLSSALSDSTQLEITAPGYFPLRTTRGFLRQKGDLIYLLPTDFDGEFFDVMYSSDRTAQNGYDRQVAQFDTNTLSVYVAPDIISAEARASIALGVNAMSRTLESVHSSLRLETSLDPNAFIVASIAPTIATPVSGSYSVSFSRITSARLYLRDQQPVDSVLVYQILFWIISHHQIDTGGRSFTSYPGAKAPTPSDLDLAVLRIATNRCGGARLEDGRGKIPYTRDAYDTELRTTTCIFPPTR